MKPYLFVIFLLFNLNSYAQEICKIRVTNHLKKTDRTLTCKAYLNETVNTLVLTSVSNSKEVLNLIYQPGGQCTLNWFMAGVLQASKTIYRRSDLESNDGKLKYASRTSEIVVTISY